MHNRSMESALRPVLSRYALRFWSTVVIVSALVVSACGGQAPQKPSPSNSTALANPTPSSTGVPTTSAPAGLATVSLTGHLGEWAQYGNTVDRGCSNKIEGTSIDAQIFDTRTGKVVTAPRPPVDPAETLNAATCVLSGTPEKLKLIEVVTTTRPAQGLQLEQNKTTAFVYDLGGTTPLVRGDVSSAMPAYDVAGTGTGLVLSGEKGTTVFSSTDLSVVWTSPRPTAVVTADAVVLGSTSDAKGIDIRSPSGESMLSDPNSSGSATALYDAIDHLIEFFRYEGNGPYYTTWAIYDVNARAYVNDNVFPSNLAQTVASVANGKLFVHEDTVGSKVGMEVWNVKTGQLEFKKTPAEYGAARIADAFFFDNHLYLSNFVEGGDQHFSVTTLPDQKEIGTTWTTRPAIKLKGWTLVLVADSEPTGNNCRSGHTDYCTVELIRDQNGAYPGPWL
jgi:hypothetical protein